LKKQRGCFRFGLTYQAGEGDPLARWRVDYTGDEGVDYCSFCPASLGDRRVAGWIYEAIDIEHPLGGLDRVAKRPIYHLPSRVIDFYKAALAARDRFSRELEDAKLELLRG
jgi:hypothetical protein